ncbi:FliI/YscN family ATPase [Sphingosinicella sp.]|uniref:FliI/YscN family ATPase n=1 Tax=Sphingosinicella sp. TaxID=1917971 RepID=UPI0040378EE1
MSHAYLATLDRAELAPAYGHVRRMMAGVIEASGPAAALGALCEISGRQRSILAEIAAVRDDGVILIPFEQDATILRDGRVVASAQGDRVPIGDGFAGRAVDALGRPIDGREPIIADAYVPLAGEPTSPLERLSPARVLETGIRAIDGLLTLGVGQRIGIFAASGVGKTSLIERIVSQTPADHVVACLVGERGREVESLWRALSARADKERFTIVAATSDESAALRARAAGYALCLAEYWRGLGREVLLVVDSVTRLAMALREIGLAAGAPPTVRAYTPNIFSALPRLVERCGALRDKGAITAVMTVLSETDDVDDPIVELMKSLLDGHIILSRQLAEQNHFPAIDIPRSISRSADRLLTSDHAHAARQAVTMLSAYEEARVMIETGVYKPGANATVDRAIQQRSAMTAFLRQAQGDVVSFDITVSSLGAVAVSGAGRA